MSEVVIRTGTVKELFPKEEGTSNKGKSWTKQGIVVTCAAKTNDGEVFHRDIYGEAFNRDLNVNQGDKVEIAFTIASREYKGRWFTNLNVLSVNPVQGATPSQTQQPAQQQSSSNNDDGLPF